MFVIDDIISELVSQSVSTVQERLNRNEKAIQILEKFNLKPDEPPEDFEGVYIYTLIEYGTGKPQTSLKLFRHNTIKAAFQEAFEQDNPNLLLETSAEFIERSALGAEIQAQNLDYRRELAEFSALFIEIAKRSRTPQEIMRDRALQTLQHNLSSLRSQIQQLNLPQIQREIAQLARGYQALLPPAPARESELARQMRGWFEALRYDFESYETWGADYFEWIIDIPARRGFDRILIRGVEGEAGMREFLALRQSAEAQKTDEGWLIAHRRISRAVRDELEKRENRDLFGYTFDELLDEAADFSLYFTWLEEQVKSRAIDRTYVPLACTKEEIDPRTKQRLGVSRYDERDGWIDSYVDLWLADPVKEHLSVLGEFGTGKTWFALHYAWTAMQKYLEAQQRGIERPRIPLVIPLRDYAKAVNVESLFSEFIFRKHEIPIPNYSAFIQLNRMGKLLLIFDGFDEMAARIDKQLTINNFWELARAIVPGAKAILTCRTEHFPEAKEGRRLLNAELQASTSNLTGEPPQFEVLELEKFDDAQIRQVLSFRAQPETVERVMSNPQLLDLARRPVMVDLILEALPEIEEGKPVDISRIYLYAVRRKMERDIKSERTFTSMADKLYFLCELSWEMLSSDRMSLNYREFPEHLRRLFGLQEQKDLDHWHYDMMGQTMLIRNAEGDYTPAHRSLLEFFVAYKFAAELGVLAEDFAEVVGISSPLYRENRSVSTLRDNFGRMPLPKAVLDLLLPMLDPGEGTKERLLEVIRATRGKTEEEAGYVGGNAATLLVKRDPAALEGCDLSGCVVLGGDFVGASLRDANFAGVSLGGSDFIEVFSRILSVAFSPDGTLLATGDGNGKVRLWQIPNCKNVLTIKGHIAWVQSVAFSPDGQIIASGSEDLSIRLWDIRTGLCLRTLQGHTYRVRSITFSPNSQNLASVGDDKTIRLWNVNTGKCWNILSGHTDIVKSVDFSSDGCTIATGSHDNTVRLWKAKTGQLLYTLRGHSSGVDAVAFNSDSRILASGGLDSTVILWNLNTGQAIKTFYGHKASIDSVAFSSDGYTLATGSGDKTVKIWSIDRDECIQTLQHTARVYSVKFSPQGKLLGSGSYDNTVRLWDISKGECLKTIKGYNNSMRSANFNSQGTKIVSGSRDHRVYLWDAATGVLLQTLSGHHDEVRVAIFSRDGETIISGSRDSTVKVWNFHTGECLKTLQGHRNNCSIWSLALSPNEKFLATSSSDTTVKLWDFNTGECLKTVQYNQPVGGLGFSPDSTTLASGSYETSIKLWDVSTGKCTITLRGHSSWVSSVIFAKDGQTLISASDDRTVKFWNLRTGVCTKTLEGHKGGIRSIDISLDGKIIASASDDKTIKLWDIQTGECQKTFEEHINWVWSINFSPDSSKLVSASEDETIKIWDIKIGKCLKTLSNKPYTNMNITGVKSLTEAEIATLKTLGAVDSNQ